MQTRDETHDTPKCPTCGTLMVAPEGTYLCFTALAQSFKDETGEWRRDPESRHPILPEEVQYLEAHGAYRQFI